MKIFDILSNKSPSPQPVVEMARPATICPKCGKSMAAHHYRYKGEWRCKSANLQNAQSQGTPPQNTQPNEVPDAEEIDSQTADDQEPEIKQTAKLPDNPKQVSPNAEAGDTTVEVYVKEMTDDDYEVEDNGAIHALGNVMTPSGLYKPTRLPVVFSTVDGSFSLLVTKFDTLKGCPTKVGGDFVLRFLPFLKSLEFAPRVVGEDCIIHKCEQLETISGLPAEIGASEYGGNLELSNLNITSLQGIHKIVRRVNGEITVKDCPIESHVLGVFLIRGVKRFNFPVNGEVETIINKHLASEDRDVNACQEELIDAGFAKFARL